MAHRGNLAQHNEEERAGARLGAAHEEERCARERQDSARGASAEAVASADVRQAQDQVSAREAWVQWLERGY
jgi:hypothetical protein